MKRLVAGTGLFLPLLAVAMQITGYLPSQHDVYSSGYPTLPVRNTDPAFVGSGRSWTSVGWATDNPVKSFGFITPRHYLTARHFGGAPSIRILGQDGFLYTGIQSHVENTNYGLVFADQSVGDLQVGTLTSPLPFRAFGRRVAVLDLNSSSTTNTPSAYNGLSLLVYGRGPDGTQSTRLGTATVNSVVATGYNQYLTYDRSSVQLEVNDSGSPLFHAWTNPNEQPEAILLGNHAAINDTTNFDNLAVFHEAITALNSFLNDDGHALRVAGNISNTWVGSTSINISNRGAWGLVRPANAPSDRYVLFNGATAGNSRLVNVDINWNLRGLYFRSTASTALGFHFYGTGILSLGRGGITNYDISRQTFTAPLALAHSQYWIGGPGGLTITNLNLNTYLLEIEAEGDCHVTGTVSGSGGIALASGRLILGGNNTYTGALWVHEGVLIANGDNSASAGVRLDEGAVLSGFGRVSTVTGSGTVAPGQSAGCLRVASLDPSPGLDFAFEFTQTGSPIFTQADASGNDVLRLPGTSALTAPLTSNNSIHIYFSNVPVYGDQFLGGFFLDANSDFLTLLQGADLHLWVADPAGTHDHNGSTYSPWSGSGEWKVETLPQIADFDGEGPEPAVEGRILSLKLLPPPSTYERWTFAVFPEETPPEDRTPDAILNTLNIANRFCYAFGLDPLDPDSSQLPYLVPDQSALVLRFRRRKSAVDLVYTPQTRHSLVAGEWQSENLIPTVIDPNLGDVELVEIRRPLQTGETLLFLRVLLEAPPAP